MDAAIKNEVVLLLEKAKKYQNSKIAIKREKYDNDITGPSSPLLILFVKADKMDSFCYLWDDYEFFGANDSLEDVMEYISRVLIFDIQIYR